jgi:predicted O-methyltransferase YrrM
MSPTTPGSERIATVRRIFEQYGIGDLELLERWSGDELEELAESMTEEEFQLLLDRLEASEER